MAFHGVTLDVMVRELNLKFKLAIQAKGGLGIRALKNMFHRFDELGSGSLDAGQFESALAGFG